MRKFDKSQIVTAVEFGTSKISVVIAQNDKNNKIQVLAHSSLPSNGTICKGEIIEVPQATEIFQEVLTKAERDSGIGECDPENIYVAITGKHIKSTDGFGTIIIDSSDRRIETRHINEVQRTASTPPILNKDEIKINSIGGHFMLDGQFCETPLNRVGNKLEAHTHIIIANRMKLENALIPVKDTHCENPKAVFSGLASAWVAVNDSEQETGALFIDFGAGTTEYILLYPPGIYASGVIALGCEHIANDIALALEVSFEEGKKIFDKVVKMENITSDSYVEVKHELGKSYGKPRKIPADTLNTIINLRVDELFKIIRRQLKRKDSTVNHANCAVITGGGSLIQATELKAKEILKIPVRIHHANNMKNFSKYPEELISPANTMITGLIVHGFQHTNKSSVIQNIDREITMKLSNLFKKVKTALKV